jgi:hypothetical protein
MSSPVGGTQGAGHAHEGPVHQFSQGVFIKAEVRVNGPCGIRLVSFFPDGIGITFRIAFRPFRSGAGIRRENAQTGLEI